MKAKGFVIGGRGMLIGCLMLVMNSMGFAQQSDFNKKLSANWSLNLNAGPTIYWGYFSDKNSISSAFRRGISTGYGIILSKQMTPVLGISGQLLYGSLQGRKDYYGNGLPADLNFTSDMAEGNISAKISLTNWIGGYKSKRLMNVYGLMGVGLSNFNGRVIHSLTGDTLYKIGNGSGKGINGWEVDGMATIGLGLSVRMSKDFDFTIETSMKFLQTDKLGRVKGLLSYDMYSYSSIGITYKIGVPGKVKPKKTVPIENKPIENKKETPPVNNPVKVENKPAPEKPVVVSNPVPDKPVNKIVKEEKVSITEPNKEEVKTVAKNVPTVDNTQYTGYKVQICAMLQQSQFDKLMEVYKLSEQIREDHAGKWYRYSVGEFQTVQQAKAYAKLLIQKNKTVNAFVVKFVNGIRVGAIYR